MYVITKDGKVVSSNAKQLKKAIKAGKMPDGEYIFTNRAKVKVFGVKYTTVGGSNNSTRIKGEQFNIKGQPMGRRNATKLRLSKLSDKQVTEKREQAIRVIKELKKKQDNE